MKTRAGTREGVWMEERRWTGPCRGHPSLVSSGETRSCCQREEETKRACGPDECPGVVVTREVLLGDPAARAWPLVGQSGKPA